MDGLGLVDLDRDLLAAGEQVVLIECVGVRDLLPVRAGVKLMQPDTLLAGDIATHAVATSDELRPQ